MPPNDTRALTEQALTLIQTGNLSQARALYEQICRLDPRDAEAWMMLGNLHGRLGAYDQVVTCCRRAIELRPDTVDPYMFLGNALLYQRQPAEAAACYQKVVALQPDMIPAWVMLGRAQIEAGRFEAAEECCRKVIAAQPDFAEAHGNLGVVLHKLNRPHEALASYQQALRLNPNQPAVCYNHGLLLQEQGRLAEAEASYREAVRLKPDYAQAPANLGYVLRRQYKLDQAIAAYREALRIAPENAEHHHNLGLTLQDHGRHDEADACQRIALRLRPDYAEAYSAWATVLQTKREYPEAIVNYEKALRLDPDDAQARYMLSALGATPAPSTAPPAYVTKLFDDYAGRFDRHLVQQLEYRIPAHLREAVGQVLDETRRSLEVLDLGCGTGLCGPLFRDIAARLTGVDLSAKMIEKARERGVYDELRVADITEAMRAHPAAYDLILAADVFIYVGELVSVFAACRGALKPGGLLAFSIEAAEETDTYVLRPTGRYAHASGYIRALAQAQALREIDFGHMVLRKEKDSPMPGYTFILRQSNS